MPPSSMRGTREARTWGGLPTRMRLLYITTVRHAQGWLADAFAADSACQVELEEVLGITPGLSRLREETFDAILVTHDPEALDALDLVEALRTGGSEDPVVVLGAANEQELAVLCHEVGADGYCCIESTTTRSLLWTLARAIEHQRLLRENRQLVHAQQQRLAQETQDADRLLAQQRALIQELERLRPHDARQDTYGPPTSVVPDNLTTRYRELLRAHVMMGSGNLAREIHRFAELLISAGISPQRTMLLHVESLEELIRGLGNRSARHVMNRADLLMLEVLMHLCDGYRPKPLDDAAALPRSTPVYHPPTEDVRHHRGYA